MTINSLTRTRSRIGRTIAAISLGAATLAGTVMIPEPAPAAAQGSVDLGWYGSSVYFYGDSYGFANLGDTHIEDEILFRYNSSYSWFDNNLSGMRVEYAVFTPGDRPRYKSTTMFEIKGEAGGFFKIDSEVKPGQLILIRAPHGVMTVDPLNSISEAREGNNVQWRAQLFF